MDRSIPRTVGLFLLVVLGVALGGIVLDEVRHLGTPDRAQVTFSDDNETLGTIDARVAASFRERFVGLSLTNSLGSNEGMLFVHDRAERHGYVMRGMSFPIDIVFVAPNGSITQIHHADADGSEGPYRGYAKWVVEVPHNWSTRHDVDRGDTVRIDWNGG